MDGVSLELKVVVVPLELNIKSTYIHNMPKQTEWTKLVKKTYDEGHRKNAAFSLKDAMKLASKTRKSMGRKQQGGKEVKCDKNEQTGELVELNNGADNTAVKSEGKPESKPTEESTAVKLDGNPESKPAEESTAVAAGGRRHKRTRRGGNYSKKRSSRSRSKRSAYW